MLYSGHLVIVCTFSWNRSNHGQTLIEKPLYSDTFIADNGYSDTISWQCVNSSSQIYLFIADTPYFLWENKNKLLFDFQMFLFATLLYFYIQ